ncbi:MAG: cysteine desulfurase [Deltaproteobacteria bacterium]|nr:cysteine desulfurase [Deltaproteobacteria bacterium]
MNPTDPLSPGELALVSHAPTDVERGATPPLASPGVGMAATRVPSGPSLPDAHPASMHLAAANSGLANPFLAPLDFSSVMASPNAPASSMPASFSVPLLRDDVPAAPASPPAPAAAPTPAPPVLDLGTLGFAPVPALDAPASSGSFDAHALKREFPILQERVHGKPLVWLDNAATTQKPRMVIERVKTFYERENSNIHRAAHALAARATDAYESARETVRRFLNASSVRDVVFVRGATEGINLVAQAWGRRNVKEGDEIVVTHLEHHANIVPWQMLCKETGAILRVAPVDDTGQVLLDDYQRLLSERTKLVALPQVSNALGTVTPAARMIEMAHRHGARVLLDGAQSVSHLRVDVQQLGCDFFVFSGHKVFAPTGIGAVVAPAALLDETPPWQGGGNMIQDVTFERTVYQPAPARFEAGTGNIADAVGLGAALDWLSRVGLENVERHEHELLRYGTEKLLSVPGLRIIGTAPEKAGVLSFVIDGHDTQTIAKALDQEGIAVRGGHHCAQPILRRFGLESTVRASLAPYNTLEDLDALTAALCRMVGVR